MKRLLDTVCLVTFVAGAAAALAQQTREQAVGAMRKVDAKEMDATYTTPAPFAQKLVDERWRSIPRYC